MSVGRPRAFDTEQALDRAVDLFWTQGYEGTSLADLTEAMGINKPSLYAAFGNKESLFRKAIERYQEDQASYIGVAMAEPTARKAIEKMFASHARFLSGREKPPGCMTVQSAMSCSKESRQVQNELVAIRRHSEDVLRERLEQGIAEGDLPEGTDVAALAKYLSTVSQGMALKSTEGVTYDELMSVASMAMCAWPA
jgi:AcrR family transcriptional regulator